jgi:hypothetical protein
VFWKTSGRVSTSSTALLSDIGFCVVSNWQVKAWACWLAGARPVCHPQTRLTFEGHFYFVTDGVCWLLEHLFLEFTWTHSLPYAFHYAFSFIKIPSGCSGGRHSAAYFLKVLPGGVWRQTLLRAIRTSGERPIEKRTESWKDMALSQEHKCILEQCMTLVPAAK